jgi:hypothetical protein
VGAGAGWESALIRLGLLLRGGDPQTVSDEEFEQALGPVWTEAGAALLRRREPTVPPAPLDFKRTGGQATSVEAFPCRVRGGVTSGASVLSFVADRRSIKESNDEGLRGQVRRERLGGSCCRAWLPQVMKFMA